jgi:multidrug efflux pump subunit AcrB
VRNRLRGALLEAYATGEKENLLSEAQKLQAEIVRMLEVQKDAGEVSIYDLTQARLALDGSRLTAIEAARAKEDATARLAAALGMLPLAYGIGSGADMLKPLAIAVIGALCISVLLSLIATPTIYYLMVCRRKAN